jgi:NADPH-dependent glutamate synthase beta subunit-like oxidoreductase/Pyruvate/2-oxoacid:ferredoxin oxidoreductase delta subunit
MSSNSNKSNPILDSALNYQYPEYSEEQGISKVVAFGEHSHRCPIYVRQNPPCTAGCPAGNDIRFWLTTVRHARKRKLSWEESYELAWHEASKTTPLPAVCGRVCSAPCETACNRSKKEDGAVNISAFERFIGDYGIAHGMQHKKLTEKVMDKTVAVIGAGPAGLSCAFQLARRGYPVTIFEANADPGGMLRYGIPPFKLPRNILAAEIDAIVRMGVKIKCNTVIGKDISLAELKAGFDAIFIGIGAQEGLQLGVKGDDAVNVFSAVNFLKKINSGEAVGLGDKVVVIGGGDSALIVARIVRRLGAEVTILYRRTNVEMPANEWEVREALAENINIQYLVAPMGIRTEDGKAVAVQCLRTELGEPDDSGRRRPVPVEGSDLEIPCTALILAIGQRPEGKDAEQYLNNNGWLKPDTNWSVAENIYAGGAAVSPGQVTTAIGQGRMAAERMAAQLEGKRFRPLDEPEIITPGKMRLNFYKGLERNERSWLPVEERFKDGLDLEIDFGITEKQFRAEAMRCMSCGLCFECRQCQIFCPQGAISAFSKNPIGEVMYTDYNKCVGCHICSQACPCGYIRMAMADEL